MKLTKLALHKINTKDIRPRLAIALGKSESTIFRYIANNDEDLTKAAALMVIRKETGLTDSEILEECIVKDHATA
jgi:hypothetical protein